MVATCRPTDPASTAGRHATGRHSTGRHNAGRHNRALLLGLVVTLLCAFTVPTASAASVAYIDGNEVWVATTDGSVKQRLSGGENDWRQVAQSDQGWIVGVRLEANKVSGFSQFKVWDPNGKEFNFGPLSGAVGGLVAYPLSLDLSPDGKMIYYGFSQFNLGTLRTGYYVTPSSSKAGYTPEPPTWLDRKWPTLIGDRAVVLTGTDTIMVQNSVSSNDFTGWFQLLLDPDETVTRTDVSATGTVMASESYVGSGIAAHHYVGFSHASGMLGMIDGFCLLSAQGQKPGQVSISQDASEFAWQDDGGVKVAGTPVFSGSAPTPCNLSRPPVVISPTGSYPSIGPFKVTASAGPQPGGPQSGGPGAGTTRTPQLIKPPSKMKLSALLRRGVLVSVRSQRAGTAKVTLTVKPKQIGRRGKKAVTIASGKARVKAGVTKRIRLKLNRTGKKYRKKLRGKRVTLTVTLAGKKSSKAVRLR